MPKQKVEVEICVPTGYEATGEYRAVRDGEQFLWGLEDPSVWKAGADTNTRGFILRRVLPPTLTVELPRELADWYARGMTAKSPNHPGWVGDTLIAACRAALAAECDA